MAYLIVVDDDEDFAAAAAGVLRRAGHEVRIELDTDSALASMEERLPDLVALDVMFPEDPAAGFKLARTIRRGRGRLKGVPVLMLTAVNPASVLGFQGKDDEGAWVAVEHFLEKPVDLDTLRRKVEAILRDARSRPRAPGRRA